MSFILNTNITNLCLRRFSLSDAEEYARLANNYNIWRFLRDEFPYPYTKQEAAKYIKEQIAQNPNTYLAIEFEKTLMGDIHIHPQADILRFSGFLGFWLGEEYWGKGFMTEVLKTMVNHIFSNTNLMRIVARVFANNPGSIKVLQKAGFQQEGLFPKAVYKEGIFIDQHQFSIVKP
ncbi:MAG: GNAT family protein [Spirochaetota bacterium]